MGPLESKVERLTLKKDKSVTDSLPPTTAKRKTEDDEEAVIWAPPSNDILTSLSWTSGAAGK